MYLVAHIFVISTSVEPRRLCYFVELITSLVLNSNTRRNFESTDITLNALQIIYTFQEYSIPYTPSDTETLDPSLADSGFNDALSLQCLESVFDWKGQKGDDKIIDSPASPTATCMHHCLDHQGFEDYLDDIYYHRLSIEYKYVVTTCLENQPEVKLRMISCSRFKHVENF